MALKPNTIKKIEEAMRRFVALMKLKAIGPHALSKQEIKDLLRSEAVKATDLIPKTALALSYINTHGQVAAGEVAPKATRDGAIDFLERMLARYVDKAGEQFTTDIMNQLEANIMPFTDRTEGQKIYGVLKDKGASKKYLGNVLKDQVENWTQRWKLIVNTELARASQYGALDAILHNNKGKDANEVAVYKIGPNDGATCKHCREFWYQTDGATPKVYRLSELLSNGTNIGKKRADWKPTVDNTHPNERHKLVELRPGYGFENGRLVYKGKDHDEYKFQRSGGR